MATFTTGIKPGNTVDLTLYAVPKAFCGEYVTHQRNALISWTRLRPRPHIVIIGDEAGIGDFAQEFGLEHVPEVGRNRYGTPRLQSIVEIMGAAATDHVGLINADIVVFNPLIRAWQAVRAQHDYYLMIGRRITCPMGPLDFSTNAWRQDALAMATGHPLEAPGAIDYFLWRKGAIGNVPDLTLGRTAWDNWLVGNIRRGVVVNATPCVVALHPQHRYGAQGTDKKDLIFSGPEAKENRARCSGARLHSVNHATWYVDPEYAVREKIAGRQQARDTSVMRGPNSPSARSTPDEAPKATPLPQEPKATPPPQEEPPLTKARRGYSRPMLSTSHKRSNPKRETHDPGVGGMRSI
jgi:hypothetical protein